MVEGSTQSWAGDRGSARCHWLLLVLVPIGSCRGVGTDPTSRAGAAPKRLAEIRGRQGCYPLQCYRSNRVHCAREAVAFK